MKGPYRCDSDNGCGEKALYKFQEGRGRERASYCVECEKTTGSPRNIQKRRALIKCQQYKAGKALKSRRSI